MELMERDAAIRLMRALVARGLGQSDSMANVAIRSIAVQAGLDDQFDPALEYAIQHRWFATQRAGGPRLRRRGMRPQRCSSPQVGAAPVFRVVQLRAGKGSQKSYCAKSFLTEAV
jgi:hypothetical protein